MKSFKKCCIFNATDEADDDMLWNEGVVRNECEEDKDTDREDRDSDTDW